MKQTMKNLRHLGMKRMESCDVDHSCSVH